MPSFITPISSDFPASPDVLHIVPDTSLGIEDVREAQRFVSRKPNQSPRSVVIFEQAHLLTLPAQNAALKLLEEPPEYADIYLVTPYPDQLLPTVLSRCQISRSLSHLTTDPTLNEVISQYLTASTLSDRLLLLDAQNFTRESLSSFLDQFELYIHNNLNSSLINHNSLINTARKYLSANCSLRLLINFLCVST